MVKLTVRLNFPASVEGTQKAELMDGEKSLVLFVRLTPKMLST